MFRVCLYFVIMQILQAQLKRRRRGDVRSPRSRKTLEINDRREPEIANAMQIAWNEWIFNYFSLVIYYCAGDRSGIVFGLGLIGGCGSWTCRQFMASGVRNHKLEQPTLQTRLNLFYVSLQKIIYFSTISNSVHILPFSNAIEPSLAHFPFATKNNIQFILTLDESTVTSRIFIKLAPFIRSIMCTHSVWQQHVKTTINYRAQWSTQERVRYHFDPGRKRMMGTDETGSAGSAFHWTNDSEDINLTGRVGYS